MKYEFVKSSEKKEIIKKLEKFGVEELPLLLIKKLNNEIYGFSGNFGKEEIVNLGKEARVESIGVNLLSKENENLVPSFDFPLIMKTKNSFIEINEEQKNEWLRGNDLDIKTEKGYFIIKFKDFFLGTGKSTSERISNLIPRERRIKN